jgi:hypothetical protein
MPSAACGHRCAACGRTADRNMPSNIMLTNVNAIFVAHSIVFILCMSDALDLIVGCDQASYSWPSNGALHLASRFKQPQA